MQFEQQQQAARARAQHYNESCEFYGLFEANSFDEEVQDGMQWLGLVRDEDDMLQVYAQFTYDVQDGVVQDSGTGWWV